MTIVDALTQAKALVTMLEGLQPAPAPATTPVPTAVPTPTPAPSANAAPIPTKLDLNLASVTCLQAQYRSDRYERFENHTVLAAYSTEPFHMTSLDAAGNFKITFTHSNIAGGGILGAFPSPMYALHLNGVERARYTRVGAETVGTFAGALDNEPDGPLLCEIVALDASGNAATTTESLPPYWMILDRNGGAKDAPDVIFQTNSFEWTHQRPFHLWARVPKAMLGAQPAPLPTWVTPVAFATALAPNQLTRSTRVPATSENQSQTHYPVTDRHGNVSTANIQAYFKEDISRPLPRLPHLDGPRGVATVNECTFLRGGRDGKVYGCDAYSFWVVDNAGNKRTLAGIRYSGAHVFSDDALDNPLLEWVGNWDASIPATERFPWSSWGMAWDNSTIDVILNSAPIPPGETEHPHAPPGPTCFVSDRHGYVLKMRFDPLSHATPAVITRHFAADDPWGVECDSGVIYVAERQKHRIAKYDVATGNYLGDLIANAAGAPFCVFDAPNTTLNRALLAPGVTLEQARAQSILAPETIVLQDGFIYWGCSVQRQVRRIEIATGKVDVVCEPFWDTKSIFVYLSISDGTFGPRGTVFTTTFSNEAFGRPQAWLPTPGTAADGTALTNSKLWNFQNYDHYTLNGCGGASAGTNYGAATAVKDGALFVGSASHALDVFTQKAATDVAPDYARMASGCGWYLDQGHWLLHGNFGYGYTQYPLPWGENADCDYWLTQCGHTKPA